MQGRMVVTTLALALGFAALSLAGGIGSAKRQPTGAEPAKKGTPVIEKVVKSEEEWKRILTPEQYRVLRKEGTERAFTGKYWNHHGKGTYVCAACGLELFSSDTKFDSGTGWPSYWAPVAAEHIAQVTDRSLGMIRIEVECARCGGHLGHLFDDGPKPTGLRYCINSASLEFAAKK